MGRRKRIIPLLDLSVLAYLSKGHPKAIRLIACGPLGFGVNPPMRVLSKELLGAGPDPKTFLLSLIGENSDSGERAINRPS
jgi:hypothetical protein